MLSFLVCCVCCQVYERLELIFPSDGFLLLPHNVNTKIKTNRYVNILIHVNR